ncbi:Uncharacterized protein OBRU01_20689, partial [Operophtera brumata]
YLILFLNATLRYSYGYNCHKYFNLCACDETVVCWGAGSIITFLDVNTKQTPDGELLASVGKDPDYNLTIWTWKRHRILLRTSAFTFDVNGVMFSPYCPGQLTTAETFTGLKLKGDLGRFGKTEICDVLGVYPMPDEKVLSGCEWGNVLVWEAGLVKSRDGCIRAWYWDTVEQADPPEDDPYVELNPVAETCVPGCQIMCMRHQKGMYWYAQDGNGGLWSVDLEIDKIECDHRKVMTFHAGRVVAMAALRTHPILITAGADGALMAFSTENHRLEALSTMRDIRVHSALTVHSEDSINPDVMDLISLLKPHSKSVTQISINYERTLLVTCGKDSTIFMYKLELGTPFTLQRLGFIETPNNVEYMTWKPDEERVILLCGQVGFLMEALLPEVEVRDYLDITTFKLDFVSYKETLVKKQYIDEEALKAKEEAEKYKDDEEEEWLGAIELNGIWVVQRGTGALLLVKPGVNKVLKYAPFEGACCDKQYLIIGTNTGYIRVVRMPSEEDDSEEHHYETWMIAQQKLMKKLLGRRLAKEDTESKYQPPKALLVKCYLEYWKL